MGPIEATGVGRPHRPVAGPAGSLDPDLRRPSELPPSHRPPSRRPAVAVASDRTGTDRRTPADGHWRHSRPGLQGRGWARCGGRGRRRQTARRAPRRRGRPAPSTPAVLRSAAARWPGRWSSTPPGAVARCSTARHGVGRRRGWRSVRRGRRARRLPLRQVPVRATPSAAPRGRRGRLRRRTVDQGRPPPGPRSAEATCLGPRPRQRARAARSRPRVRRTAAAMAERAGLRCTVHDEKPPSASSARRAARRQPGLDAARPASSSSPTSPPVRATARDGRARRQGHHVRLRRAVDQDRPRA